MDFDKTRWCMPLQINDQRQDAGTRALQRAESIILRQTNSCTFKHVITMGEEKKKKFSQVTKDPQETFICHI